MLRIQLGRKIDEINVYLLYNNFLLDNNISSKTISNNVIQINAITAKKLLLKFTTHFTYTIIVNRFTIRFETLPSLQNVP